MTARRTEAEKALAGTQRRDRALPEPERSGAGDKLPDPPADFDEVARREWYELGADLERRRLLTGYALKLLGTVCRAQSLVHRYGRIKRLSYPGKKGAAMHHRRPEPGLAADARREYNAQLDKLGAFIAAAPPVDRLDAMDNLIEGGRRGHRRASAG